MKKGSTIFLRVVVFFIALAALSVLGYFIPVAISQEPVGGYLPILIGLYVPAIPFYIALFQTIKLLNFIDGNTAFSDRSTKALSVISICATSIAVMFSAGLPYIFPVADRDDAPGVIAMTLIIIGASIVIAVFAAVLRKLLQNAIDIKKENELVV